MTEGLERYWAKRGRTCIHSRYDPCCIEGKGGDCDGYRRPAPPLQVMMASFEVAFRRMERSMIALGRAFQQAFEDAGLG